MPHRFVKFSPSICFGFIQDFPLPSNTLRSYSTYYTTNVIEYPPSPPQYAAAATQRAVPKVEAEHNTDWHPRLWVPLRRHGYHGFPRTTRRPPRQNLPCRYERFPLEIPSLYCTSRRWRRRWDLRVRFLGGRRFPRRRMFVRVRLGSWRVWRGRVIPVWWMWRRWGGSLLCRWRLVRRVVLLVPMLDWACGLVGWVEVEENVERVPLA